MKNATIRQIERFAHTKNRQPLLWDSPKFFDVPDWFSHRMKQFRKTQNARQRAKAKASDLVHAHEVE